MKCVDVKNVVKSYKTDENHQNVLNGINLTLEYNKIYTLIGSSACGKTTLLHCILGMQDFKSGEIRIFNQKVEFKKRNNEVDRLIGFMPQKVSLVSELTIRETLQYFARLYEMNQTEFNERLKMLSDLLQLPSIETLLNELSGGEQRRVSLAIAIIHNPKLLILDEPTVGLDCLLRDRIWKFLHQQARETHLTVLITTHVLSEATRSNFCGFMRDGILIAEDKPKNIIKQLNAKSFDEAFLILCNGREKFNRNRIRELNNEKDAEISNDDRFRWSIVLGILILEFHRIKRQPPEIFNIFLSAVIQIAIFSIAIGVLPSNLKLGVVNINCSNPIAVHNCTDQRILFEFYNRIDGIEKIYYNTYNEAYDDFKKGNIEGIINNPRNFIESLIKENKTSMLISLANLKQTSSSVNNDYIEIMLDNSKFPILLMLKYKILKAFDDFIGNISSYCDLKDHLLFKSINIEPMFAPLTFEIRDSQVVFVIASGAFALMLGFSSMLFIQSRRDGFWNRTMLSGVNTLEIIIAYTVEGLIIATMHAFQSIFSMIFILKFDIFDHFMLIFLVLILNGLISFLFGLAVSITTDNCLISMGFITLLNAGLTVVAGVLWPIEGASPLIRPFSKVLPTSLSGEIFRNVIFKAFGIEHPIIYCSLIILTFWILILFFIALLLLRFKRFSFD